MGLMTRLEDLNVVINQTEDHRQRILIETSRLIRLWKIKLIKIKSIYFTMNMFNNDIARKCFIAECWIPTSHLEQVQLALRKGSVGASSSSSSPSKQISLFRKSVEMFKSRLFFIKSPRMKNHRHITN